MPDMAGQTMVVYGKECPLLKAKFCIIFDPQGIYFSITRYLSIDKLNYLLFLFRDYTGIKDLNAYQ